VIEAPVVPLPFTRADLRRAVPSSYFRPSTGRALAYLGRDLVLLALVCAIASRTRSPWLLLPCWLAQGTLGWALFVIGHDCGHGAFSRHAWLNSLVGHATHTPLLVPYHAWRVSHRLHHRHTADLAHDEAWVPLTAAEVRRLPWYTRLLRFRLFAFGLPFYLARRAPGRSGSHFNPWSPLFPPRERRRVAASVAGCGLVVGLLAALGVARGPWWLVRWYLGPYAVFAAWVGVVTYLHHGHPDLPWYRGREWSALRGALSTVDRHYGLVERLHHDAGAHVAHHLFPSLPHYRLRAATRALRPVLGSYYREARTSAWRALWEAARTCAVVPEDGGCVYPQPLASGAASRPATR
jgi:omega-3 fatty acid desaturase (delta-15 desaturase)